MSKLYVDEIQNKSNNTDLVIKNGTTTALTVDTSSYILTPERPAFSYRTSTQNNISVNAWQTVNFNDKLFEVGSNFNTSTKSFVAPVNGIYQFNVTVRTDNVDSASSYIQVKLEGAQTHHFGLLSVNQFNADLAYMQWSGSASLQLNANDSIEVQIYQAGGSAQTGIHNDSRFQGFLVG